VIAARHEGRRPPSAQPPAGLPGLDPAWSRAVQVTSADGRAHTWHVLDSAASFRADGPTLLCVHGNPTWSYLWRRLLGAAPTGWRVVAPDQLGMGYSDRLDAPRTLPERIRDLGELTAAMDIAGPVVIVAHDWGGVISLGWALAHREQVRGVVLINTAVHQPEYSRVPLLIRLARLDALRETVCVRSSIFVRAATALSWPPLPREVRAAYAAPYHGAGRRHSVGDFVTDIPVRATDPSRPTLDAVSDGIRDLDVPALLLWGPRDPVFAEHHLRDLRRRLPQAELHRYQDAGHLVPEDAPRYAEDIARWVRDVDAGHQPEPAVSAPAAGVAAPVWQALVDRAAVADGEIAIAEVGGATISWGNLNDRVRDTAAGLIAAGVRPGDRVALLIPPSIQLTVAVYAVWRAGAAIVVADKGLGMLGMGRALRSAGVDHVIGTVPALGAAAIMRLPGTRLLAGSPSTHVQRLLRAAGTLTELAHRGGRARADGLPDVPLDADAAVVFTSGATGAAKGVLYRHRQLQAQLSLIRTAYPLSYGDRIVAAFAPFALYGPALGVASAVPDTDVTAPATLTAAALADAVLAIGATVVFGSPAALRNVAATGSALTASQRQALTGVRLMMSAGAPVSLALLRAVRQLLPSADARTPYGMTEVLPVSDVSLADIEKAGQGDGVCVGRPLPGVDVMVSPVDALGRADGELTAEPGVTGELCVRAAHVKQRYDALWATERASSRNPGWHRTGDVGLLDAEGRLWVQGRIQHLITTSAGVLTPIGLEQRIESVPGIRAAAVVGVGPAGIQLVVVIIVPEGVLPRRRKPVADLCLTDAVRAAVDIPVAAVLTRRTLPVDIRHASKVDRAALAKWAETTLAGRS
jgi:olefin beta-lactone synthetase